MHTREKDCMFAWGLSCTEGHAGFYHEQEYVNTADRFCATLSEQLDSLWLQQGHLREDGWQRADSSGGSLRSRGSVEVSSDSTSHLIWPFRKQAEKYRDSGQCSVASLEMNLRQRNNFFFFFSVSVGGAVGDLPVSAAPKVYWLLQGVPR